MPEGSLAVRLKYLVKLFLLLAAHIFACAKMAAAKFPDQMSVFKSSTNRLGSAA
jgi:hypothetical protein